MPLPLPQGAPRVEPPVMTPEPAAPVPVPVMPVPVRTPDGSPGTASSTSTSGQFIVYGAELRMRSGIAGRCEELSQELGRLLRNTDPWVLTVVVKIQPLRAGDPPDLGITTQVSALEHGGFHLQLNVPERSGLRPADFRRELVRLLLMERILRSHKQLPEGKGERLLPAWALTGVLKAMDYRSRGRPSAEFAAIFKSGKVYGIEEILDAEPTALDGLSRTIYETSSCALMLALLDQPEGPLRFGRFLAALAVEDKPQRELLKQWFPGLAESEASLNKWWSLQLASLAAPNVAETLDPTQTAELLDKALTFRVLPEEDEKLPKPRQMTSIASQRPAPAPPPTMAAVTEAAGSLARPAAAASKKAAGPKTTKPEAKSVSRRPKDVPAAPVAEEEEEKEKRGFLRSLFPFTLTGGKGMEGDGKAEEGAEDEEGKGKEGKEGKDEKAKAEPTKEEAAEARAKARQEKAEKEEEEREAKKKAAEAKAAEEKAAKEKEAEEKAGKEKAMGEEAKETAPGKGEKGKEEPAKEKGKGEKDKEEAPVEGGRGSLLNPLKWFRGKAKAGDEGSEPAKEEGAAEKEKKAGVMGEEEGWARAIPADRPDRVVRDLLGNAHGRFIQAVVKPKEEPARQEPAAPMPPVAPPREGADLLSVPALGAQPAVEPARAVMLEGTVYPIEDFAVVMARTDKERVLKQTRLALIEVKIRGNALFREVVEEYVKVVDDLLAGKTKDVEARLKALRKRAVETYKQACAVQDHLDWYEATQSTRYSGLFEDFITLPARVSEELPPRKDPISKYLDEVEAQLGR